MQLRSVFLSAIKWFFGLILLAMLILFVVNLVDDELAPELKTILDERPAQIDASQNGYFAWIGVIGPEKEPPHAWGQQLFQAALNTDRQAIEKQQAIELSLYRQKRQETLKRGKIPCHKIENCLQIVAADPKAAEEALQQGKVTLSRSDGALAFTGYQEAWRPDVTFYSAMISHLSSWAPLATTRFALKAERGEHDEALAGLEREIVFHTRQLLGTHTLFEKLMAQHNLIVRYQLLSQYMARHPQAARAGADRIAIMLAPFPTDATSLKPALRFEARVMAKSLLTMKIVPGDVLSEKIPDFLLRPVFLPKATANEMYQWQKILMDADGKRGNDYRQHLDDYRKLVEKNSQKFPFVLRNPIGSIMNMIAMPDFTRYFLRRDNLLASRELVAFQFELLKSGVTKPDAIARAVEAAPLIHSFTGGKAKWDADKRTLGYGELPDGKELGITLGKL